MKKKAKKAFTLIELMVVIFIIGLITSVIGFNMRGSLDKGRAFKTKEAIYKLYEIVNFEIAKGAILDTETNTLKNLLESSGLVRNADKLLQDGWNEQIIVNRNDPNDIKFTSTAYETYCNDNNQNTDYPWE